MRRDPDEHHDHRATVEQRARAKRREDPDRDRERQPEDGAAEHERGGDGRCPGDDVVDVLAGLERLTERLLDDQLLQEVAVLLPQRVVQVEPLRDFLYLLRRRALARDEPRRVGGSDVEDQVGDERDGDEEEHRPEEPPDDEAEHRVGVYAVESGCPRG
jgi:hypothetical protein